MGEENSKKVGGMVEIKKIKTNKKYMWGVTTDSFILFYFVLGLWAFFF